MSYNLVNFEECDIFTIYYIPFVGNFTSLLKRSFVLERSPQERTPDSSTITKQNTLHLTNPKLLVQSIYDHSSLTTDIYFVSKRFPR